MATHLLHNGHAGQARTLDAGTLNLQLAEHGVEVDRVWDLWRQPEWSGRIADGDRLLVAGGDGTLNHAVSRSLGRDIVLGILPLGTGNDLARSLGVPLSLPGAARVIAAGHTRAIDVGRCARRVFLNVAHIGLGARVGSAVSDRDKRRLQRHAYLLNALRSLRGARSLHAEVCCDGETRRGRWLEIGVANGRHFGGGRLIDEAVRIDDGRLHVVLLRPRPWWSLAGLGLRLGLGLDGAPRDLELCRCRSVEVRTRRPHGILGDGERLGWTPNRIEILPRALRVLAPEG